MNATATTLRNGCSAVAHPADPADDVLVIELFDQWSGGTPGPVLTTIFCLVDPAA